MSDAPHWPDDREEAAALLRQLAKNAPIEESSIPFVIGPWMFLTYLPEDVQAGSVREVVSNLLDDPDPLVARRAIVFFGDEDEARDDAMFARFLTMAERLAPGPTADELQRVLAHWTRDESEVRRVAAVVRRLTGEGLPAALKPVALYEPEWLLAVATRRSGQGNEREQWGWAYATQLIASFHPALVLSFLTALRPVATSIKHRALDRVGERLAAGTVERPTLAECRAAIAEDDESPRRRFFDSVSPAPRDIDRSLVAFVRDALSADCTVNVERTDDSFPGDVNEPPRESVQICVDGARRGGASVKVQARIGEREMWIDIDAAVDERDRILYKWWRTYGTPR